MPASEATFDPLAPYPAVVSTAAALNGHDWPSFRAQFINLDWISRTLALRGATPSPELEQFLERMVAENPDDVLAPTALAEVLIDAGWKIRSGYRASHVSDDQFRQFHDHLRRAERLLVDVIARDPAMVAAWELRLKTARGLQLGQSEARRRYDQLSRHHPHHLLAQQQYLQEICPKWSGSFEKAHAFGRECLTGSPEGSMSPVIVADNVIEHWFELDGSEAVTYAHSAAVKAELREAADRSVFHPSFQRMPGWVVGVSTFACAFTLAEDLPAAAACFRALGPYAHEWGWRYLKGGAEVAFARSRKRALEESA